ncbi:hypothetical protein Golax_017764, partial [Gossypium laxum]|nr:hypothetical protein [Gossypium laxum]
NKRLFYLIGPLKVDWAIPEIENAAFFYFEGGGEEDVSADSVAIWIIVNRPPT